MCRCDCLDASHREKPMERAGKGREQVSEGPACTESTAFHALAQCPHSARTVPVQCPHSARCENTQCPHSPVIGGRVKGDSLLPITEQCGHCVFSQRALCGHCAGTVRALCLRCVGAAPAQGTRAPVHHRLHGPWANQQE